MVTSRIQVDLSGHMEVFSSGFSEVRTFLADLLYLQIDRYHHILMYQGYDWRVVSDYLPQLWLVTRLNPTFPEPYIEGGYHLAVNLGYAEEGIGLLREGLRNCPDDPGVLWEYAYVSWEVDALPPGEQARSLWDFLKLERRLGITAAQPDRYASVMNAGRLLWWTFRDYPERANHLRIAGRYESRVQLMMEIRRITREVQEGIS
jgi:hypothetical protein